MSRGSEDLASVIRALSAANDSCVCYRGTISTLSPDNIVVDADTPSGVKRLEGVISLDPRITGLSPVLVVVTPTMSVILGVIG